MSATLLLRSIVTWQVYDEFFADLDGGGKLIMFWYTAHCAAPLLDWLFAGAYKIMWSEMLKVKSKSDAAGQISLKIHVELRCATRCSCSGHGLVQGN